MQIEIRGDRVHISGYVNAVGRDSRPIPDRRGTFVEQVEPGPSSGRWRAGSRWSCA